MKIVQALREASDFYAKERPRATLCELQTEIGQNECEGIARRFDDAATEIERLRAALRLFVDMPETFEEHDFLDGIGRMRRAFDTAKAALQPLT